MEKIFVVVLDDQVMVNDEEPNEPSSGFPRETKKETESGFVCPEDVIALGCDMMA